MGTDHQNSNSYNGYISGDTIVNIYPTPSSRCFGTTTIKASEVNANMLVLTRSRESDTLVYSKVENVNEKTFYGKLIWYKSEIGLTDSHHVWNPLTKRYMLSDDCGEHMKTNSKPKRYGHWNPIAPKVFKFVFKNRCDIILGDYMDGSFAANYKEGTMYLRTNYQAITT